MIFDKKRLKFRIEKAYNAEFNPTPSATLPPRPSGEFPSWEGLFAMKFTGWDKAWNFRAVGKEARDLNVSRISNSFTKQSQHSSEVNTIAFQNDNVHKVQSVMFKPLTSLPSVLSGL